MQPAESARSGDPRTASLRNFDDLTGRLLRVEQREEIALAWEQNNRRRVELSAQEVRRLDEVEQWYLKEIGVAPLNRNRLKEEIMAATLDGCRRSLKEVLASVDQLSNKSRWRFDSSVSAA